MQTHSVTSLALFAAIVVSAVVLVLHYPTALVWLTYEDLYGEWAQTYFFVVTFLICTRLAFMKHHYRVFFGLLAFASLYVAGEEISWGQRLLDFDSPDYFKQNNLQREANIHNLLVGPYSTVLKDVIEYTLASSLLLYGLLYPVTLRVRWTFATWVDQRLHIPAPPIYLAPFFIVAASFEVGFFHFNEAEFAEILVGFALSIMSAQYWYASRKDIPVHSPPAWNKANSRRFALIVLSIAAVVSGLAYATTAALLNLPEKRARIESRVLNGYEKFARRYERRGHWDIAAKLYREVHRKEPNRTFILRQIAKDYKKLGNDKLFWKYNNKALSLAQKKYKKDPGKISTNLTMARTYRQRGDIKRATVFAERAHEIALERAEKNPNSAHWAYWLGKTAGDMNDDELEYEQYKKAFELKQSSTKYRKAFFRVRNYRMP